MIVLVVANVKPAASHAFEISPAYAVPPFSQMLVVVFPSFNAVAAVLFVFELADVLPYQR